MAIILESSRSEGGICMYELRLFCEYYTSLWRVMSLLKLTCPLRVIWCVYSKKVIILESFRGKRVICAYEWYASLLWVIYVSFQRDLSFVNDMCFVGGVLCLFQNDHHFRIFQEQRGHLRVWMPVCMFVSGVRERNRTPSSVVVVSNASFVRDSRLFCA